MHWPIASFSQQIITGHTQLATHGAGDEDTVETCALLSWKLQSRGVEYTDDTSHDSKAGSGKSISQLRPTPEF